MDIVKKHWLSMACGVVALICVGVLLFYVNGQYEDLQGKLVARQGVHSSLQTLLNRDRQLPIVDPERAQQEPLDRFPSRRIIDDGKAVTSRVAEESQRMLEAVVQLNRKELLVPGSLPAPGDAEALRFRSAYNQAMTRTLPEILQAGVPPTQAQIDEAAAIARRDDFDPRIIWVGNTPANKAQVDADFDVFKRLLPARMRTEVATRHKTYLTPDALEWNQAVTGAATPTASNIFWAQVLLWVQQEVAQSIAAANAGAQNVLDSAVKRVVKVRVPMSFVGTPTTSNFGGEAGPPPPADPNAPIVKAYNVSPSGRTSNPLFDVMHFTLTLDVDPRQLNTVLAELTRNKLLTVLKMNLATLDTAIPADTGYMYGDGPVVQVTLDCEILFMRRWLEPLMPEPIKRQLNIAPAQPQPAF